MAGDQHSIFGAHQIGLNKVGAPQNGQPVGLQGVFGEFAAGATMADDQGRIAVERLPAAA